MQLAGRVASAVVGVALAGCAHISGDFPDRMPRNLGAARGPSLAVRAAQGFVAGDEFDLDVRSGTESSREMPPVVVRWYPWLADSLPFVGYTLSAHVRVDQAQRGLITTASVTVTSGAVGVGERRVALTGGRGAVLTVLGDAVHPMAVASEGRLSDIERVVFSAAFSQSPLFVSLSRWFGPSAAHRVGEQWQVGVEQHGDREWIGEETSAAIFAQLDRGERVADDPVIQLRSWTDGPIVARQVGDNGSWQRRRVTRDVEAVLARGREAGFESMSATERIEYATPLSVVAARPAAGVPHTEYMFDTVSVRRTIALRNFRRAQR